jgi:hypothetical protein
VLTRRKRSVLGLRSGLVLALVCGGLAGGCGNTKLVSGGPFTAVMQTPEGTLRYSLSKSVVEIEATVTEGASGKVTFDGNDFKVDTQLVRKDARAQVSISSTVDDSQFFTLRLDHGGSSDDSLSVEIGPNGLLKSVGAVSTSQITSVAKSVVTVAASVVAAVVAVALGPDPKKQAAALVCEKLAGDSGTPGRCALGPAPAPAPAPAPVRPGTTKAGTRAAEPKPDPAVRLTGCADKTVEASLSELSMQNLYFLARSPKHRRLWTDRRDTGARLDERLCQKAELERTAERATGKELEDVRAKLSMQALLIESARSDLRTAAEDLDAAVRTFQRDAGIDGQDRATVVRMRFELDEIPPPDGFRKAIVPDGPARVVGMTQTDVRALLKAYPRMLELYDRTGIALSLTPPPVSAQSPTIWSTDPPDAPKTRIYYRPSYTAALTTYATARTSDEQGGEQDLLRFFSVASDDVVHPKTPIIGFAFEPTSFAERKLALGFDDRGRLVKLEQSGRSSVAGAASAAAESVQIARDEYAATLAKIAEIQDTKRRLEQNDVITELDRLRKQNALLDARLELAGRRSNYDLVLEKKRIDAEVAAIQSRRALDGEKGASAVAAEVAELRGKLDQLTREMGELKNRAEETRHNPYP